jgi:hypothetical protein
LQRASVSEARNQIEAYLALYYCQPVGSKSAHSLPKRLRHWVNAFFCHADTWQMIIRRLAAQSDAVIGSIFGVQPQMGEP